MKRLAIVIVLLATTASAQDSYNYPSYGTGTTPWQPYGYRRHSSSIPRSSYLKPYYSSQYNGGYSPGFYSPPGQYQFQGQFQGDRHYRGGYSPSYREPRTYNYQGGYGGWTR